MSKEDSTLAGMPTENRKEIIWGRQGLPPKFYGTELIGEALFEVLKTMDRSTMNGFVEFKEAFKTHNFGLDISHCTGPISDCIAPSRWFNPEGFGLNTLRLESVWGIGIFDINYGVISRSATEIPAREEVQDWKTKRQWDEITKNYDILRQKKSGQMPLSQIVYMDSKRVFLTKSGQIFVIEVEWEADHLTPSVYKPTVFKVTKLSICARYSTRNKSSVLKFINDFGLEAGMETLSGLRLALQSSNYRLREALEPNEKAEKMLVGLLSRTNTETKS